MDRGRDVLPSAPSTHRHSLDDRGTLSPAPSCSRRPPELQVVDPSSGVKRKRTHHQSGTPEIEDLELRGQQYRTPLSGILELPSSVDVCPMLDENQTTMDHDNTDSGGYHWGYDGEDLGNNSEQEDEDEPAENGGVEEMVDGFLQGEENRQFRSKVWTEFCKIRVGGIVTKGRCIHCNAEISAKRGSGTSAMGNHLKRCKVRQSVMNVQNQLKSTVMSPEGVALKDWRFSQDVSRRELDRMISLHGMPFALVEYDGFRRFVSSLNPVFKVTSRRTITTDTMKAFQEGKLALREALRTAISRVSLTMDMWTSNQTLGYMCITCHFLDADWKMHKRIMKFSVVKTPHTGVVLFNVVLKAIQEWNIEDNIFAITMDNASNNNSMVKLLRSNLLEKNLLYGTGQLFHQRCAGHVFNLICKAGFEAVDPIVHKIRESVKYIHGSQSRMEKFEEIIQQLGISYGKRPKIDTSTRWNSTYLMLDSCYELRKAFESLSQQDSTVQSMNPFI